MATGTPPTSPVARWNNRGVTVSRANSTTIATATRPSSATATTSRRWRTPRLARCRFAVRAAGGVVADTSGDSTEPSPYPPVFAQLKRVAMDGAAPDCAVRETSSTLVLLMRSERSATDHGEDQGNQPRRRD